MKKAFDLLKRKYANLKIKYKLFILVSWIMISSFLFTFLGLQYAFHIYDEQIYSKSSQVLSTSSNIIENELQKMEDVSYNILTDPQIQQYLATNGEKRTEYEQYRIHSNMVDKLLSYVNNEKYIQSVILVDTNGEEYVAGPRSFKLPSELKMSILREALLADGKNIWVNPHGNDFTIVTAREIRQYKNLSFEPLGTLIINMNMDKLVSSLFEGSSKIDGEFLITNDKELIYPTESASPLKKIALSINEKPGYQIKTIGGKNYFLVHINSHYFDWSYVNAIPFNQIFKNISFIKTVLIIIFILMFFIVTILGIRFVRNITIPLENLVEGMQYVQNGDFKEAQKGFLKSSVLSNDEVGKLHETFQGMTQQIDELVNENLSKQLTIKETEFKALQAQINPHFLYNTLESINWLAKMNDQDQISKMVEALGFLLRNSISLKKKLIPIEDELNIVKNYIVIQKYRFEERLDFNMQVDSDLFDVYIPKLTLQPLVENAIHYALENMVDVCKIRIYSVVNKDYFQLIVEDNGPGMEPSFLEKLKKGEVKTRGQGIGLANIMDRIKLSFGNDYGVEIESEPNNGAKIILVLPYDRGEEHVQSIVS
ncbi:two-component system sensor histidine kinase YesM [Neobacillus bataviensis]|uniref:histidine kinase n=1 Tax=Neobacillus bataviensis TaxID=220685 RepID=A0A561CAQ2_9BACI|nr:sensor histidine kinase [Neobacillus bataviensis]TWD88269.1 two-component system sensor histidine kinase YesM [Neobacillus bataviensis]